MYPVQSYMNPYSQNFPQQRNESSYPYHHHPSWNATFPRMRMDSPNPPTDYEPWPHNIYAYPKCSGCCSHGYAPGHFGFRPPYSHFQPPSQCYYHYVPHPPYPNGFSANLVPPPYFPMQQQVLYERDKDQHHCCGCPNHKYKEGRDSSVKIEEEIPEGEHIDPESSKLIRKPNYSHPTVQAPGNLPRDGDSNRISESYPGYRFPLDLSSFNGLRQGGQQKKPLTQLAHTNHQGDREASKSSELHPSFWIPLDLSGLSASRHGDENGRQTGEKTRKPTSSPVFWLPSYSKPETADEEHREVDPSSKASQQISPTLKILPLKSVGNENVGEQPGVVEVDGDKKLTKPGVEKDSKVKTIPAKQADENSGTKFSMPEDVKGKVKEKSDAIEKKLTQLDTKKESKVKTIPVKQVNENGGTKFSMLETPVAIEKKDQNATKLSVKKEASPVKTSKLPPVCLRVDPLPKKKRANSNSRSPNPPGQEKTPQENNDHVPLQQDHKDKAGDRETKLVDVKWEKSDNGQKMASQRIGDEEMAIVEETEKHVDKKLPKQEEDSNVHISEVGNKGPEKCKGQSSTASENIGRKNVARVLSPTDASVIIQSAFRGYEVRRWQPLEKLRKIARARLQANDIRKKISDAEASKQLDQKEKVAIGEAIMDLLLQLDTIQGLHPSVREIRKSMAKELICLQERLDLLGSQASEGQAVAKAAETSLAPVDYQLTPVSGTLETKQPKDVYGLSGEEVEISPGIKEQADDNLAVSGSILAGQIELHNMSLPSNEDLNSQEGERKEKIEEPDVVPVDGQSAPANCDLDNEQALAAMKQPNMKQPEEVQEVQSEVDASNNPKVEENEDLKAADSQDSDSAVEINPFEAVLTNKEPTEGQDVASHDAASEDGCLMGKESFLDGHNDQHESPMQATELNLEAYKSMEVPDLTVIELPEYSKHKRDPSGAITGLQEEEEKEALELDAPATDDASTEVSKDMVVPELAVILPELDEEVNKNKQDSSGGLQEDEQKEEQEVAVPVMNNASTEVHKDMDIPDFELPVLDKEKSWAPADLQEVKEKELTAPVINSVSAEVFNEIIDLATAEKGMKDAVCPSEGVGESSSKCPEEQVESAKGDGEFGFGDSERGVVTISLMDAKTEDAHRANTKSQNELLDSVRLAGPTFALNDYCTSEDYKRTMEELDNCGGIVGQFDVSDAQEDADEGKVEESKGKDILVIPSEEQIDDAFNEGNIIEAPNAATVENDVLLITGVVSTSEDSMESNDTVRPQSEGSSADVQGELLVSPQEAVAICSRSPNSEEKKLLEENEKLREMLERLLEAGKQQLQVISDLNGRVKHLENQLSQKGKTRAKRHRFVKSPTKKTVSLAA